VPLPIDITSGTEQTFSQKEDSLSLTWRNPISTIPEALMTTLWFAS
jgi:hypothetical protein